MRTEIKEVIRETIGLGGTVVFDQLGGRYGSRVYD